MPNILRTKRLIQQLFTGALCLASACDSDLISPNPDPNEMTSPLCGGVAASVLSGNITKNTTLSADKRWLLVGPVSYTHLNLQRAADLVQSFKQVAVDQSHGLRRRVRFGHYLSEVLMSLAPLYKRTHHTVNLHIAEEIEGDVHAGAIAQILGNLIQNAITHAFVEDKPGQISLTLRRLSSTDLELVISDNGRGMTTEERARIFEPFFTTRRGQGGSGLGMHIVHNLVTELLKGTISVQSQPGAVSYTHLEDPD